MTANDLERRVADFYDSEAPRRAPDRVLQQALATIDHTRQRRELGLVPWRSRAMNNYAKLAAAAVAVLAVAALGLNLMPRAGGSGVGGAPSASAPSSGSPSPAVSAGPSASPSPSPALTPAPLAATYTSKVHGLSVQYPAGWTAAPATVDGSAVDVTFLSPQNDYLYDPVLQADLFLALGSYALDGQTGQAWATAALDADEDCTTAGEPITVDGWPGLSCGEIALTWAGERGYSIRLYASNDQPGIYKVFDRAWFEGVLATVDLPGESGGPSPSS